MKSESEVTQSYPTLCNPVGYCLPDSSIHGILQARILEWVAISFSKRSSWPRDRTWVSDEWRQWRVKIKTPLSDLISSYVWCAEALCMTLMLFKWMITVKLTLINLVLWEHKLPPPRFLCNVFFQSKSDQLPAMSTPNYTGYKANKSIKKNLYSEIHVKISNAKRQRCWFIVFIDKVYRNKSSI